MAQKTEWLSLEHEKRVGILAKNSDEQIIAKYRLPGQSVEDVQRFLAQERALWIPNKLANFKPRKGEPPTKHSLLGSYRDLERSEAILELIDNSIDARRASSPSTTDDELNIFIDIDQKLGLLRYEDNAGGVPEDKLDQLVVPGYSDTTDLSASIGSYRTGGKKAVFRLATRCSNRDQIS